MDNEGQATDDAGMPDFQPDTDDHSDDEGDELSEVG